ncbi:MAG: DUF1080 domain-containing protein [Saprospiraceae bacterium]|nr:DUF1080 domain-containing protein [Saprospiraceae bacterium]
MKYLSSLASLCILACLLSTLSCTNTNPPQSNPDQDQEEWQSLFNGKDLTGWDIKMAGYPVGENFRNTWRVQDSMIRISYDDYEQFDEAYGHMYYQVPYSYYKIRFDYRFTGEQTPGGATWNVRNSGIMVHSQSAASNEIGQHFPVSIELQLLGGLSNGKERTTGNLCSPGTAVVMGDTINYRHCISSSSETYNGDQWVHAEMIVLGDSTIIHLIEGDTVLQYDQPQIGGGFTNINQTREHWEGFGITKMDDWVAQAGTLLGEGYIALQAESHPIDFKNIELLDLVGCKDPKAKNYKSYFVKADNSKCEY